MVLCLHGWSCGKLVMSVNIKGGRMRTKLCCLHFLQLYFESVDVWSVDVDGCISYWRNV